MGEGALMRRSTDAGEPTNRELLERIERLDRTMQDFMHEHSATHAELERWRNGHTTEAALRQSTLSQVAPEVAALHDMRIQVSTINGMIRWVFGASLLGALGTFVSLLHVFGVF